MKLRNLLTCLLIAAVSAPFLGFIPSAGAVSLSPLTFELIANPGETVSNIIRVTNTEDYSIGVNIDVEDFVAVGEEGQVALENPPENLTYSLAKWVTVSPKTFTIGANETVPVEFRISVPLDGEPGGHYSSVLATVSANAPEGGGVGVTQKVGSLLLLNVAGDVEERLHIAEFSAPEFSEYGPVTILSRFENTGTVHVKPRGFILVKNMFGREVKKLDLPQKNVLPSSIRRVEVPWGNRLMFGRYEATLTAIYGSSNAPISAVTTFWVIPWKIVGGIVLGLLILLILLFKSRKRIRLALRILFKGVPKRLDTSPRA